MKQHRKDVRERIQRLINEFLAKDGHKHRQILNTTNMIKDLGLSSLQGVDFALDLCDEFCAELPNDFNPFVHDAERRGRTFDEMVSAVESLLANLESTHESE